MTTRPTIDRRAFLKTVGGLSASVLLAPAGLAAAEETPLEEKKDCRVYEINELSFTAKNHYANPYLEVDLWVALKGPGGREFRIPAFWDGGATWRARLVATVPGDWQWSTGSKTGDAGLDHLNGSFSAKAWSTSEIAENPNRRGFIRMHQDGHTLEYADGTPFFYAGDTWWSCLTAIYAWDNASGAAGISFQDAVNLRKSQGLNGVNIISCFPTDLTNPIWHPKTHGKKVAEDGSTPFEVNTNETNKTLAANYLKIIPAYWQHADRKMKYFWDQGFVPFIETVRRSEGWPEENDAEKKAYTNFVKYLWARWGAYNWIFSWVHWDNGKNRNEAYRPMIESAYQTLGNMPYGQPKMAMAAGASDDTWGHGGKAPWMNVHNVSNISRDATMFTWLRRQFALEHPLPSMNIEPFYPGWNSRENRVAAPLNDSQMAQFLMYGSVLNGGFAGHSWGDVYYAGVGNNAFEYKGQTIADGDPHKNGFNRWSAASMGHLKSFLLDNGHDYRKLAPATTTNLATNRNQNIALALSADKSLALGFVAASYASSDVTGLTPNREYLIEWWDIDNGTWLDSTRRSTDNNGLLDVPETPDQTRGWGFRIRDVHSIVALRSDNTLTP